MGRVVRIAFVSPSPLIQAVWGSFFTGFRDLNVLGGFATLDDYLRSPLGSCDVLLLRDLKAGEAAALKRIPPGTRLVCLGPRRKGCPPRAVWVSDQAGPNELLSAMGVTDPVPAGKADPTGLTRALTEREVEVLSGICEGLSLKEIAARHDHTVSTVQARLKRIMNKLGVTSRSALVLHAAARGHVPCPCRRGPSAT